MTTMPALYAQQVENGQVLSGLGHDAFIGGDNQQGQVNAAHSGQHVLDEALVSGHIHNAHFLAAGQFQPGEAEVDGHAPFLFLAQAVGVNAGQGLHQGGLAVVNMSGGTQDKHDSPLFGA